MIAKGLGTNDFTELQGWAGEWSRAYKSKKERKPAFLFAHLHEEASEAWKEWREGRIAQTTHEVKKHGRKIRKTEGLGAELADVVILAFAIADDQGLDLDADIADKRKYLEARLAAKLAKREKK